MGQITSLYAHKVISQLSDGVETRDLLLGLGIDPEGKPDPALMVSSDDYYDFFEALALRDPQGLTLSLRIGASMRSDDYGAFGLAWKSAPDLRGSFVRSERYGIVLGSAETYSLQESDEGWFFTLDKAGDGRMGMRLSNEASLSAVDTICKEVSTEPFTPLAVCFRHKPRGDVSVYEAHFGCPVQFEAGRDALLISETSMAVPNKLGDETIAGFFDRHLEAELARLEHDEGLDQRVRIVVSQALSEGVPTLTDVATSLGMSARTLQRRLSDKGHSFQSLVDLARRELAEQLLRETGYSLAEVAFLTGVSEQSGFTRAFKRWAGQTPRSYRLTS